MVSPAGAGVRATARRRRDRNGLPFTVVGEAQFQHALLAVSLLYLVDSKSFTSQLN